jgi:fructose-bisphosphate aldolase class 1
MNQMGPHPWPLSFSYGRAMQTAALKLWAKDMQGNFAAAQKTVPSAPARTAWPRSASTTRRF